MKTTIFIIGFLCQIGVINSQSFYGAGRTENPEYVYVNTLAPIITSDTIYSTYVDDKYTIFTSLPVGYDASKPNGYPVVFYLDGKNLANHTVNSDFMSNGQIPKVITVSIGYPSTNQRTRDYTYSFSNFYNFLRGELIPLIDQKYNVDKTNRTLFGHSYGGLCAFFTLLRCDDPEEFPFKNIISSSPTFWWPDNIEGKPDYCVKLERDFRNSHTELPVNFYMTMGSEEGINAVSNYQTMVNNMYFIYYRGFKFKYVLNPWETHASNAACSYKNGILWVFAQFENTSVASNIRSEINISPNPSSGIFNINIGNASAKNAKVEIVDFSGKMVLSKELGNGVVDLTNYGNGIYVAKITMGNHVFTEKLVVK